MLASVMRFGISTVFSVALLCSCDTLTEERAPTPDCVTGKHWVGGDIGHEEMHPGRDCVGCHVENDGPPLALGGTVYPGTGQADDCYGSEGVDVLVQDANGRVFEFVTNAAGNFYLEGDESQVAKPYKVKIRWTPPIPPTKVPPVGTTVWDTYPPTQKEEMMSTAPLTGDCGSCHLQNQILMPVPGFAPNVRSLLGGRINLKRDLKTDFPEAFANPPAAGGAPATSPSGGGAPATPPAATAP